jgi:CRP/FNR family transcriptional regulator
VLSGSRSFVTGITIREGGEGNLDPRQEMRFSSTPARGALSARVQTMALDVQKAIAESSFFRGVSPASCRQLAGVSRRAPFRRRDTLFVEGSRADAVYLLLSGFIQLQKGGPGGELVVIKTVRAGETFAEAILFERDRYPVTAVAVAAGEALAFPRAELLRLLDQPAFRNDFIAMLMGRMRYLAERVAYLTACDVERRFFLFLHEQYGERTHIRLDVSKKDVAAAIAATPETFSRLMARLRRRGLVKWQGKTVVLPDDFWRRFAT